MHFNVKLKMKKLLHYTNLSCYQNKSVTYLLYDQKLCYLRSDFHFFLKLVKSLHFNRF